MNDHQKKHWRPRFPKWLGEEWVLPALLAILVMPVATAKLLSIGVGIV
jgi:hypothetical protein